MLLGRDFKSEIARNSVGLETDVTVYIDKWESKSTGNDRFLSFM